MPHVELQQLQDRVGQLEQENAILRQLLAQHVGEDVARHALESGINRDGETRFVSVLFVDLVGSTTAVATKRPSEVVAMLNAFFEVVVEVVGKHGGWVNKFVGDEALAVFGAPAFQADAASAALAAARELTDSLCALPGIRIGIGVAAGTVLAGNIGSANRLEYTVIGDPVNEAARLTELAKKHPGCVLASGYVVGFASEEEQTHAARPQESHPACLAAQGLTQRGQGCWTPRALYCVWGGGQRRPRRPGQAA
jgi:adenylate cyclase